MEAPGEELDAADGQLAGDHPPVLSQPHTAGSELARDQAAGDGALNTEEAVEEPGEFRAALFRRIWRCFRLVSNVACS